MYKNNLWKDQYGIRAPFSNKSRVYYTIIIWLMRHNTMNARMKMWQGYTDCMTWNVNKRKQTAGGWERAGGHRLATVRGLRLWLCLDWLITELICIFFNFKQTTNFSTIHLQNVIHQSGCGRTSVKNLLEFWDGLYTRQLNPPLGSPDPVWVKCAATYLLKECCTCLEAISAK